jgi:hypothetical protein
MWGYLARLDWTNGLKVVVMQNSAAGDYALTRNQTSAFVRRGAVTSLAQNEPLSSRDVPPDMPPITDYRPPVSWFIYNDPLVPITGL